MKINRIALMMLSFLLTTGLFANGSTTAEETNAEALVEENEGKGIQFFEGTYEEALELAKRNNKLIFVDVYTTWCGPCKKLEKNTFTDEKVGAFMNEKFISLRLDAENQAESAFFKSYSVTAYPTMFWLSAEGEILDQYSAYIDGEAFLKYTNKAMESNFAAEFNALKARWDGGEKTFELFNEYVRGMVAKVDAKSFSPMVVEFVKTLSEEQIKSRQGFEIVNMTRMDINDKELFPLLLKHWDHYLAQGYISDNTWKKMYTAFVRRVIIAKRKGDDQAYEELQEYVANLDFNHKDVFIESLELEEVLLEKKYKKGIKMMVELADKYKDYPFLRFNYLYTLILNDYFLQQETDEKLADMVIDFAKADASYRPSKRSILLVAVAYANKGDFKSAYGYLANLGFYPQPMLTNAVYNRLNLPVTKTEFPW